MIICSSVLGTNDKLFSKILIPNLSDTDNLDMSRTFQHHAHTRIFCPVRGCNFRNKYKISRKHISLTIDSKYQINILDTRQTFSRHVTNHLNDSSSIRKYLNTHARLQTHIRKVMMHNAVILKIKCNYKRS